MRNEANHDGFGRPNRRIDRTRDRRPLHRQPSILSVQPFGRPDRQGHTMPGSGGHTEFAAGRTLKITNRQQSVPFQPEARRRRGEWDKPLRCLNSFENNFRLVESPLLDRSSRLAACFCQDTSAALPVCALRPLTKSIVLSVSKFQLGYFYQDTTNPED
jgi:hypothetical protein